MILSCVIAFAVTLIVGRMLIPVLRRLKAGQSIRDDGPTWHMSKQGTPTMGGLMFIIGIGIAVFIAGVRGMMMGSFVHLYVFVFALAFGIIGYIDDYKKVTRHQNEGLTALQKFVLQLAAAVAFLTLMRFEHLLTPNVYIPFFNVHIHLNWVVYLIFAAFVIVGTVNAVNITDGIDGLWAVCPYRWRCFSLAARSGGAIRSWAFLLRRCWAAWWRSYFTISILRRSSWATRVPFSWEDAWPPWPLPMICR